MDNSFFINLPEEVNLLICKCLSNRKLSYLKFLNKHWLNFIIKYQEELFNINIIKSLKLNNSSYIGITLRNNKTIKTLYDNNNIPKYLVVKINLKRDFMSLYKSEYIVYDIFSFKKIMSLLGNIDFGTNHLFTDYDMLLDYNYLKRTKIITNLKNKGFIVYYKSDNMGKSVIINDYKFSFYSNIHETYLFINERNNLVKSIKWHHVKIINIKYQQNKYIVISSNSFTILNTKFEILHTIYTKSKFVHANDKFYILKDDNHKIYDYKNNLICEIEGTYYTSYVIYNYMYLIGENIDVYNLITHKFEDSICFEKCYICDFNDKFIIYCKGHKLFCIYF